MRVYVGGPMGGIPGWNYGAFDAAAAFLRALGHDAVNPADIDREIGLHNDSKDWTVSEEVRQDALRRDFLELVTCDAIALLPGWENSRGARAERRVAEDCGIAVYYVTPWASFKPEVAPVIVALSGYGQVGKDTAGAMMGEIAGFERIAFADPLKAVALQCDVHLPHPGGYRSYALTGAVSGEGWERTKRHFPSSRVFLQHLGVAVREYVDPDAWVNAALRQVKPGGRYAITDCRFPNEAAAVKAAGGYVVRVERPGTGPVNAHASETALDDFDFDAILRNTGTIDDLRALVRIFLSTL